LFEFIASYNDLVPGIIHFPFLFLNKIGDKSFPKNTFFLIPFNITYFFGIPNNYIIIAIC